MCKAARRPRGALRTPSAALGSEMTVTFSPAEGLAGLGGSIPGIR